MTEVTRILNAIEQGDLHAAARLWTLVYQELRQLAAHQLARESPGQTLQATALVHEAYLRLVGNVPDQHWHGRAHFFGAAAEAMRRILVENARRKRAATRGGNGQRLDLDADQLHAPVASEDLLALDRLARVEPQVAELVKLRYFAGLSIPQAATTLGVSPPRPTPGGPTLGPGCSANCKSTATESGFVGKNLAGDCAIGPWNTHGGVAVMHWACRGTVI
jgi:RNA polymerase sigma factor (TIGR02999 family)